MTATIAKGPTVEPKRCPVARDILHIPASTSLLRRPWPVGCSRVWNMSWRPTMITTVPATVITTPTATPFPSW